MKNNRSILGLAVALGLVVSFAVPAQDVETAGDESNETDTETQADLGSIEVTARRRTENLRDVPISVTAISGEGLSDSGAQDITYLNQVVPNTTLEVSRGTSNTLTAFIRGIGQQDPVAGFEAGVGIYVDDVYLNRPQAAVLDIFDVERIEVLRGPQGTLYGRNTIGGAVKYVTRRLGRQPAVSARASLGNFSQRDLVVSGETPVGSNAAIGASLATLNRDGFGTNLNLGEDNYNKEVLAGRVSTEWSPTHSWFVRLAVDYYKDDSNPVGGHRLIPGLFSGAPVLDDVFDSRSGIQGANETEQLGVSLLAEYDINPDWQFKSITAWRDDENTQQIDFEALPAVDVDVPVIYDNEQFSQEFQLNYVSERISGVTGFYYLDANAFNAFDVRLFQTGISSACPASTHSRWVMSIPRPGRCLPTPVSTWQRFLIWKPAWSCPSVPATPATSAPRRSCGKPCLENLRFLAVIRRSSVPPRISRDPRRLLTSLRA